MWRSMSGKGFVDFFLVHIVTHTECSFIIIDNIGSEKPARQGIPALTNGCASGVIIENEFYDDSDMETDND